MVLADVCPVLPFPLQIMYIVLVFGGYGLFVMDAYPRIPNMYMASYHKYVSGWVLHELRCPMAVAFPS